jgi:serine phosphatase RsbU (regulator of sigma subunit)
MVHRDRDENDRVIRRFSELQPHVQTSEAPIMQVLAGGGPSLYRDSRIPDAVGYVTDMELLELCDQLGICSAMYVPLTARGRVLGCLTLVSGSSGRFYDEADLEYAVDLANRAALVIDNSSLYEREHRIAEVLQNSLLPTLPEVPGLQIASRHVAGDQARTVGGDFFDLIELPCGGVGLAVGAVAGHDLDAAAAMGQLRGLFRAYAWESCEQGKTDPAGVLDRLDWYLRALNLAPLATVLYVHTTRGAANDDWQLAVASAGHLPLLVRYPGGTVDEMDCPGFALGAEAGDQRTAVLTSTASGSTLVMFTDGLVAQRDQAWDAGFESARTVLKQCNPDATAAEIADLVVASIAGDRRDAVAVLVVTFGSS